MKNKQMKKSQEKTKTASGRIVRLRGKGQTVTRHKDTKNVLPAVGLDRPEPMRKTGIDILGDAPWGTHFCQFYHTKEDLIDILVPYFKTGLENNEFCLWVTSEPLNSEVAKRSLKQAVKNLEGYIRKGQIEILDYTDWYTEEGVFEADKVLKGCVQKHDQAIKRGFDGIRLTGDTFWLQKKDWKKFANYEAVINKTIGKNKMLAICTYSLEQCTAAEMLDVENNHQFSLIRWKGNWKILESSTSNHMEARLAEQTMIAEVLQRGKEEWEKTFNAISDWVAMTDLKGRILRTNRAGEDFTGIPVAEIVGQSCCKLVHGSEKPIPGCPLLKMLATGQCATAELQVPQSSQWLMVTVDPITDQGGKIVGTVHIARDITKRKKIEETLRESEQKYKEIVELAPDGIVTVDLKGMIRSCNPALSKRTGYSINDFVGRHISKVPTARLKDIPKYLKIFGSLLMGKVPAPFEFKWIHKNGTEHWGEVRVSVLKRNGKTTGFQAITRDITERKRAEQEIRNLAKFPSENPNPVLRIRADGTLLYANAASTGLLRDTSRRLTTEDAENAEMKEIKKDNFSASSANSAVISGVGQPAPPFLLSQKARGQFVKDVLEAGSVRRIEVEHAGCVFAFVVVPVVDANYVNFYGTDITELRKAEQEARDAQQKLIEQQRYEKQRVEEELAKVRDELVRTTRLATIGQVSASIAHDLRNPLGAVRNASYFLRSQLSKDQPLISAKDRAVAGKAFEHLEIIDQEVIKADQIITNLLEMARPRMPNKQAVDLAKMVSEVLNQVRRTETVRCLTSLVPEPFVVWADPHQLRQAITNIVSNAVDAMKGHGELFVDATRSSDYDTLIFRDTGPGFAPEVRDKVFEPLVTTKATGTGMGLTICRQIVEKHGGTIDAEDCQGRGAAIRIHLPRK